METMNLYWHPISGHSHRAKLFLSLLKLDFDLITVDLKAGEHKQEPFLKINAFGQVPVLADGDRVIADSNAILVYLAKTYDQGGTWFPEGAVEMAEVEQFLSLAANRLVGSAGALRAANIFNFDIDKEPLLEKAHLLFSQLDGFLKGRDWLVGDLPTIADISMYTYTKLAPEGGVDLESYEHILRWLKNLEALDGFVAMAETPVGLRAK